MPARTSIIAAVIALGLFGQPNRTIAQTSFWQQLRSAESALATHKLDTAESVLQSMSAADQNDPEVKLAWIQLHILRGTPRQALPIAISMRPAPGDVDIRHARYLFLKADLLERIPGKLGDAMNAWRALRDLALARPGSIDAAIPTARIAAIERASEQEMIYRQVRKRLADAQARTKARERAAQRTRRRN